MRKTRKKVLGLLGLILVMAMTFFAASLPGPKAVAISSVTDTIVLRVIGPSPDVNIKKPSNDSIFINPFMSLDLSYENVHDITVDLKHTDIDGHTATYTVASIAPDYAPGEMPIAINLDDFGYGDYLATVTGVGMDNVKDIERVQFSYMSIYTDIEDDSETGLTYLNMYYDDEIVCRADVNVYLGDKLITPPSTIKVNGGTHRVELKFAGLDTGNYIVKTTAYGCATDEKIGKDYESKYFYEATKVPDTGGFFRNGNISKEDFMITGLIAFLGFSGVAIWIVARGQKNKAYLGGKRLSSKKNYKNAKNYKSKKNNRKRK